MNLRRTVVLLWLCVALLGLMCAWNFWQIQNSRSAARARQAKFNNAAQDSLRTVLCFAESAVMRSKATPEQKVQAIKFYDGALRKIDAPPCKH